MPQLKRIVLDVLKPHQPNALDFATAIAEHDARCRIKLTVAEMDENTESIIIVIEGDDIDFAVISHIIADMGGSIHSIDEVEVVGS